MVIIEPAALCAAGSSKRSFCEAKLYFGYSYFILPYIQYRSLGNLKDAVNAFTFSGGGFMVVGKTPENCRESKVSYTMVEKVVETTKLFLIFQTKSQAFIVEKSIFSGGIPEEPRNKLSPLLWEKISYQ